MEILSGHVAVIRLFAGAGSLNLAQSQFQLKKLGHTTCYLHGEPDLRQAPPVLETTLTELSYNLWVSPHPQEGLHLNKPTEPSPIARLYSDGIVAIQAQWPLPPATTPEDLLALMVQITALETALTEVFLAWANDLIDKLSLPKFRLNSLSEDYTLIVIHKVSPKIDADDLSEHLPIGQILVGDPNPLAKKERMRICQSAFSQHPGELVVVDWAAALIYGVEDPLPIANTLEFLSAQLLQLRIHDQMLEGVLGSLYSQLDRASPLFRSAFYRRLSRTALRHFVEVSEIFERIDNALHTVDDSWLAQVHRAAVEEFALQSWQRQLRDKLELLLRINGMLADQIHTQQSLRLEWAIVALIVLEILLALAGTV